MGSYRTPSKRQPKSHLSAIFRFDDLVFDVQTYIISCFIRVPDLKSLSVVSRHIHSLAAPALFTDVKLLLGWKFALRNPRREGAFTSALLCAQRAFKKQLLFQREHTRDIRSLAWQFCSSDGLHGHAFTDLFPLLDNLTAIHVVDAHPTNVCELNHNITTLFPRVSVVRITGTTCLSFVMPMLHTPQRLTAISLDTVEPHTAHMHLVHWITQADLSNLRTLSLRALNQHLPMETEILLAWKEALSAVRLTLNEVTLGVRGQWIVGREVYFSPSGRFAQLLLPVFWEQNWPRLRRLRLEGIDIDRSGVDVARLAVGGRQVDIDPTLRCVQRIWNSESVERF